MPEHTSGDTRLRPHRLENVYIPRTGLRAFAVLAFAWALVIASTLTIGSPFAYGQFTAASLNGTISDPNGATVPDATVTVLNRDTNSKRVVKTSETGAYSIPSLTPGNYSVTVAKAGFTTSKESSLTLQVAQVATLNISLEVGSETQTVEVTSSTSTLETTNAALGTVMPEQQVEDLPLNGRQFSQLLQLTPGTVPLDISQNNGKAPGFGAGAANPGVDGQSNRSNIYYLDGIIATDVFFGGFSFSPSVDAIQEFKAQSHTDQAEFGQASGAIVSVVSRSGTNQIHGAAFEFVRNQMFDSKDTFDTQKLPYHLNQFGGSFGGPILKNKLFYYANYEGGRQIIGASANYSTVATAAERGGDFSGILAGNTTPVIYDPTTYDPLTQTESAFAGNIIPSSRIDPGMLAYLNAIEPLPNAPANSHGQNNYLSPTQNITHDDKGTIRVDYTLGANDSISGRYSQDASTIQSPGGLDKYFTTGFSGKNTGGTWVHTFSPTLIAEVTAGYNLLFIPQFYSMPGVDQAALLTSSGLSAGFNEFPGGTPNAQIPALNLNSSGQGYSGFYNGAGPVGPMNIVQGGGTVTKIAGKNTLKFGVDYYHTWLYTNWEGNGETFAYQGTWNAACQFQSDPIAAAQCPTYNASAGDLGAGGDPIASMLISAPLNAQRVLGVTGVNLIETTPAAFVQDSWAVNHKLTINLGLRWDYNAPLREKNNRLTTYDIANHRYDIVAGDADLPLGNPPPNVEILERHTIVTPHYLDFSPRVGFTFQIDPQTIVRAGAGRTFDDYGLPLQIGQNNRGTWPSGVSQNASNNGSTVLNTVGTSIKPDGTPATGQNPFYGPAVLPASPLPQSGMNFQDPAWLSADSFQWNLEVQRDLPKVGSFSVAYVGSHTSHNTANVPYDNAPASTTQFSNALSPDQILGGPSKILQSTADSSYNSLQAKLIRPLTHGFGYTAGFTWSKTLAFAACGDFYSYCIQNEYNMGRSGGDYGRAALDIPFVFTFNATYKLPFGNGQRYLNSGVPAAIAGNWQINTIFATRSGQVVNPLNGANGDAANTGDGGSQRVNFSSDPNKGAPHSRTAWWNESAMSLPAVGTFGNAQINSLRGPGYWNDDLSIFRDIPVTERLKAQLRFEAFDIFNHPNLGNPNGQLGNGNFNLITNTVSTTGPGAQRDLQFAVKLLF